MIFILFSNLAFAKEVEVHKLVIKDHRFFPDVITSSPGKVLKLEIYNEDSTIEEFESFDLKREKIVPSKRRIIVVVGPLRPGEYSFFGDFHQDTAQGKVIIR